MKNMPTNGANAKFDEHLSFVLPKDYIVDQGTNDEGEAYFAIRTGKSVDDEGEVSYNFAVNVKPLGDDNDLNNPNAASTGFVVKGQLENRVFVKAEELNLGFFTAKVFVVMMAVKKGDLTYALISNRVVRGDPTEEDVSEWVDVLNTVLSAMVFDGVRGDFEKFSAGQLLQQQRASQQVDEDKSPIPIAKPLENQHTHLDFLNRSKQAISLFGGLVNQSGTEYAFQSIEEMGDDDDGDREALCALYRKAAKLYKSSFELSKTAYAMADLFRVDRDVFDEGEDREQEIKNGYIRRAAFYDTLRSFAWTLLAYCDKEKTTPAALPMDTIEELVDFIEERGGLNYTADSFAPTLCSGDDLHVHYIPDALPDSDKKKLKKLINEDNEDVELQIASLEGLRKDLADIYPAIRTIYDALEETRDRSEPLCDGAADVLYAWCSMTYAAREAIYSEDGPMNCWWDYPDEKIIKNKKLAPVDRPKEMPKKKPEEVMKLTYNQQLKAHGEGYSIDIPDGFAILSDTEGLLGEERAFIAYLPNEKDPENHLVSDFVIFAGQKQGDKIAKEFRTREEFWAIGNSLSKSFEAGAFGNIGVVQYEREDLPGTLVYMNGGGCLHCNAFFGVDADFQSMRVQITGVSKRKTASYEPVLKELFDHMHADKPVKLLKNPDADEFLAMDLNGKTVNEWVKCVEDYAAHYDAARQILQQGIAGAFEAQQQAGRANPQKLKKELKQMLQTVSSYADSALKKAEPVYALKRAQFPEHAKLKKMEKALHALIELADQLVRLNGEEMWHKSSYAAEVKKRLNGSVSKEIDVLLPVCDERVKALLTAAKADFAAAAKAAEEEKRRKEREEKEELRRKVLEERLRKEKEEEERKRLLETQKQHKAQVEAECNGKVENYKEVCALAVAALTAFAADCTEEYKAVIQEQKKQTEQLIEETKTKKKKLIKDLSAEAALLDKTIAACNAEGVASTIVAEKTEEINKKDRAYQKKIHAYLADRFPRNGFEEDAFAARRAIPEGGSVDPIVESAKKEILQEKERLIAEAKENHAYALQGCSTRQKKRTKAKGVFWAIVVIAVALCAAAAVFLYKTGITIDEAVNWTSVADAEAMLTDGGEGKLDKTRMYGVRLYAELEEKEDFLGETQLYYYATTTPTAFDTVVAKVFAYSMQYSIGKVLGEPQIEKGAGSTCYTWIKGITRVEFFDNTNTTDVKSYPLYMKITYRDQVLCKHETLTDIHEDATCTTDGYDGQLCPVCYYDEKTPIPAFGHDFTSEVTRKSTCTKKGEETFTCSTCGAVEKKAIALIPHNYVKKVTTAATCTKDGVLSNICTVCNDTKTSPIDKLGHKYTTVTCTEDSRCTNCGDVRERAPGHTTKTGTCSRCGYNFTPVQHFEYSAGLIDCSLSKGTYLITVNVFDADPEDHKFISLTLVPGPKIF